MSLKYWDGSAWQVVAGSRPGAQGPTGATGPAGSSATIAVGTVTTLAAGQNASVTNSGTASAAILNFSIPAGTEEQQAPKATRDQQEHRVLQVNVVHMHIQEFQIQLLIQTLLQQMV